METGTVETRSRSLGAERLAGLAAVALPAAGFALLLAAPSLDVSGSRSDSSPPAGSWPCTRWRRRRSSSKRVKGKREPLEAYVLLEL
jgi:hypothetical protein